MTIQGEYVPSKQQWVRDQVAEFEASDGQRATPSPAGDPIVVITSLGAKSGKVRKNPVMRVERDGTYVAVASLGGAPQNPEWYYNFLAHPEVELQDGPERKSTGHASSRATSAPTGGSTRWTTWPTYGEYQKKTDREIPVFVLEEI